MKRSLLNSLLASALVVQGTRLAALSTSMGPNGLGAAYLGAGGAGVATAEGPDGLYFNPAARSGGAWALGYNGGLEGPLVGTVNQGLALMGPLDQGLSGALLLGDNDFSRAGYREDNAGLDLAVDLGPWLTIGTQQRFVTASPGGLEGWSMDLGAMAAVGLGGSWKLDLGLTGADMLSQLNWADGAVGQQPTVWRAGATLEEAPGTWIGFEEDQMAGASAGNVDQWRIGVQISLLGQRIALRAGATQQQQGSLYYSAGLGACLSKVSGLEADYAVLIPVAEGPVDDERQVLSLSWRFGPSASLPKPKAVLGRERTDGAGHLRFARIELSSAPTDAKAWTLSLVDRQGRTLRVFHGRGPLPPRLDWDGTDARGVPSAADGLGFVLRVTRTDGSQVLSRALLAPSAETVLEGVTAGEGGDFALRTAGRSAVRPSVVFKGPAGLSAASADFDLSGVPGADRATSWELRIVDASGRTVRVLHGLGRPPKSVRWEGTGDLGGPVDSSLGDSFEVRVTDASGQHLVAAAPLVLPRHFGRRPQTRVRHFGRHPEGVPGAKVGLDPVTGRPVYTFYFRKGGFALTPSDRRLLAVVATLVRKAALKDVVLDGFSDHDSAAEGGAILSQERADTVLRFLAEEGLGLDRATATGHDGAPPAAAGNSRTSRALNRRVELRF